MTGRSPLLPWAVAALLVVAPAAPSSSQEARARPTIYKWVDTNGIAHYTTNADDIPDALRDRLDVLQRERRAPAASAPTSGADPDDPWAEDPWAEVSVEAVDDLWVAQDAVPEEEVDAGDGFGESDEDRAEQSRRRAERRALDQQIATLQAQITADEEILKRWIANPDADPVMAADDPEFREVALRLPKLHGEMAELEQRRRAMGDPPADAAP